MDEINTHRAYSGITILVVDDHELVLRGIKQILENSFPTSAIITASTGEESIKMMRTSKVDVISVDLELPDMSGFNLIDHVRANYPDTRILVNTVHDEIWTVKRLTERCVEGIIFKSARAHDYVEAIKTILGGGTFYDAVARLLMKSIRNERADESSLSMREIDVLRLIADGLNTEQIAVKLGVKANTIETHRRHLLEKLDVRNSAELVRRAISSGIISPIG